MVVVRSRLHSEPPPWGERKSARKGGQPVRCPSGFVGEPKKRVRLFFGSAPDFFLLDCCFPVPIITGCSWNRADTSYHNAGIARRRVYVAQQRSSGSLFRADLWSHFAICFAIGSRNPVM